MIYKETVKRFIETEVIEHIEVPESIVKLVKSSDKDHGRNGNYPHYITEKGGGYPIDRIKSLIITHSYHRGRYYDWCVLCKCDNAPVVAVAQ